MADPAQTKFVLDESRIPRSWYNIAADLPVPPCAAAPPGDPPADRAGRPGAAVPDGAHRPGGLGGARDRDPRAGPRRLPPVSSEPAVPGPSTRARARYAGPHLLQVRGRQPGGQPQAEHGHPAGVLQPAGRGQAARHRDRRRAVGERPVVRRRPVRPRGQGLHGPRQLRPEAVPADPHGDLRRRGRGQPVPDDRTTAAACSARPRTAPARSGSPSARPSRMPRPATTRSTPSARCSTTCSCTRPSSARRRSSRWAWPASRRTSSSAAPAVGRTSPV